MTESLKRAWRGRKPTLSYLLMAIGWCLFSVTAHAQGALRIDIAGVGAKQIPIAIAPFDSNEPGNAYGLTAAQVVRSDLARSGVMSIVDAGTPDPHLNEKSDIKTLLIDWRGRGAEALVVGSTTKLPDGRVETRFILLDMTRNASLGGLSITTAVSDLDARRTGHRIADFVYEKLTGEPGFFATRLAFVRRDGNLYSLVISDSDGQNMQVALRSREPIISLAWSPDGTRLAYVSFELGKAVVYVHTLATGRRITLANERGSNSAPAWSADGKRLAVVLTRDGLSQIYLVNAEGGEPTRLTRSNAIDTEPAFSADGRHIYFTSDRGGSAQIYRVSVNGGEPVRMTYAGAFNGRPQLSPDGKFMAFITGREKLFKVALMDLASQQETLLSDGPKDDSPSFAPNSRWVIYSGRHQGKELMTAVSIDGKLRTRLSSDAGEVRGPAWGRLP